jgi:sorting nexin-25
VTVRVYHPIQLYPPSFLISQALDGLLALALRDFITSWYKNITKSPAFSNEVDKNIRFALGNIRDRLLKEDLVNIAVSRFVPIFTAHLRDFDQAERTVRGSRLNRSVTESEELDLAIAAKYRDGKLHTAAAVAYSDPKLVQQEHLRKILVRVLPEILPENVIGSRAVSVLIKEIVSCAALFPVMQLLSDPDTWNQISTLHLALKSYRIKILFDWRRETVNVRSNDLSRPFGGRIIYQTLEDSEAKSRVN